MSKSKTITKRLLAVILTVMMLVSMVTVGMVSTSAANVEMAETGASRTFAVGDYIYIKNFTPSGWGANWFHSDVYEWAHIWDSSSSNVIDIQFELIEGTENAVGAIYGAKITKAGTYTHVIFSRSKSSTTPWDNPDQTGDIPLDATYNCYTNLSKGSTSYTGSVYEASGNTGGGGGTTTNADIWADVDGNPETTYDKIIRSSSNTKFYLPSAKVTMYVSEGTLEIGGYTVTPEGTVVDLATGTYTFGGDYQGSVKVFRSKNVSSMHTETKIAVPQGTLQGYDHKDKYETKGTIGVYSPEGELKNSNTTLKKIKGRGNSSWEASHKIVGKYAFNITLDKKAKLIDDGSKSKKYCLVSYNADQARMRNMVAYELAEMIGSPFAPQFEPIDFYNNGKFAGSYLLTDKVEIGDPLVDIVNLDDVNEELNAVYDAEGEIIDGTNFNIYDADDISGYRGSSNGNLNDTATKNYYKYVNLEECDASEYEDSGFLLEFELNERFDAEISGFISSKGQQIVCKYPEYASKNQIKFIMNKWNTAEALMYNKSATYEQLDAVIDVESFAKMYLIQELSKNLDGGATSFYVYYDGGKLHAGVAWDYDWAFGQYQLSQSEKIGSSDFGNNVDANPSTTGGWYLNSKKIYGSSSTLNAQAALCQNDAFWGVVVAEWDEVFYNEFSKFTNGTVSSTSQLTGIIAEFYETVKYSTIMDEDKWNIIYNNPLGSWGSTSTGSTHDKAVVWLNNWIYNRVAWMDKYISRDGANHGSSPYNVDYVIQPPAVEADKAEYAKGDTVTLTITDKTGGTFTYTIYKDGTKVGTTDTDTFTFTADEKGEFALTVTATSQTSSKTSAASKAAKVAVTGCGHVWDNGVCTECGEACAHETVKTIPGKDATCTETGLTEGKECTVCGKVTVEQTEIPVTPHTEEVVKGKDATCTETGLTEGKICSVCGETLVAQTETPVVPHTEEVVKGKDATCKETGLTDGVKCSVCGDTLVEQDEIPTLAHTEKVVPGKDATCKETGLTEGKVCSVCGETLVKQDEIPTLAHTEEVVKGKDATCKETGLTDGVKCSVCGDTLVEQKEIPTLAHTEKIIPGKDATCKETGLTEGKVCTACGDTLVEQKEIPTVAHTEEVIKGKDATCEDAGLTDGVKCSVCGDTLVEQKTIPSIGHDYENGACVNCGGADPDYEAPADVEGYNISLGGNIGVKFFLKLSNSAANDAKTKVVFTLPNGSKQTVSIADATDMGNNVYAFNCDVAAKEMSAVIKAQLHTTYVKSDIFEYSVKEYAEYILGSDKAEYVNAKDLVKAMLNYGTAAQKYFGYKTDVPANSSLSDMDKIIKKADLTKFRYKLNGSEAGVTYYGSRLSLESETAIKHYFYFEDAANIPEIKVNDDVATAVKKGNYYEIKIADIPAHELDAPVVVTIGGLTLDYNALSYGDIVMGSGDAALIDVMNALCAYNVAADAYIG